MKLIFSAAIALAALSNFSPALAHEINCEGVGHSEGTTLSLEINEAQAEVLATNIERIQGLKFPVMREFNEDHYFDMGSIFGAPSALLVESTLVRKVNSGGPAEIRVKGPHSPFFHFYCRKKR